MLVYHPNALGQRDLRLAQRHWLQDAVVVCDVNRARIRQVVSEQHIHQSGFARSILTQKGQNFALMQIKAYPVICQDGAKAFGQAFKSENFAHLIAFSLHRPPAEAGANSYHLSETGRASLTLTRNNPS